MSSGTSTTGNSSPAAGEANGDVPQVVGLIGDPVAHSLSPTFQQPAFDALGLHVRYELWPTPEGEIDERVERVRSGRALGANVTVPHKERVRARLDHLTPTAERAGAVNTLYRDDDGHLVGDNTDVIGFIAPLVARTFPLRGARVVVLGAGGAARGVIVGLLDSGVDAVLLVNRTLARAATLRDDLGDGRVQPLALEDLTAAATGAHLLVNATAVGWNADQSPAGPAVFAALATDALAYDLTYQDTAFLAAARAAGVATLDGLEMLVQQGAASFARWTGQAAPLDVMLAAAQAERARRAAASAGH